MFCGKCGTQNADKAKFCKNCGDLLENSIPKKDNNFFDEKDDITNNDFVKQNSNIDQT